MNVLRATSGPFETDPELIVDSNAELALSIASQLLKPVAGWDTAVIDCGRGMEHGQLSLGHPLKIGTESPNTAIMPHVLGVVVGE
jgi:hypothetical protein